MQFPLKFKHSRDCWRSLLPVETHSCSSLGLAQVPPLNGPSLSPQGFPPPPTPGSESLISWISCHPSFPCNSLIFLYNLFQQPPKKRYMRTKILRTCMSENIYSILTLDWVVLDIEFLVGTDFPSVLKGCPTVSSFRDDAEKSNWFMSLSMTCLVLSGNWQESFIPDFPDLG